MSDVEAPTTAERESPPEVFWIAEVWHDFRPYLIKLSVDFAIFVGIWSILFAAHALTLKLPLESGMAEFLIGFHETMVVLTFVWLSLVATWDLVTLKRKG